MRNERLRNSINSMKDKPKAFFFEKSFCVKCGTDSVDSEMLFNKSTNEHMCLDCINQELEKARDEFETESDPNYERPSTYLELVNERNK